MTTTPPKNSLCILLLNYNGAGLIERCIESFCRQTLLPDQVMFIDNGSDEFNENHYRKLFGEKYQHRLKFLRLEKNVGYARAMNHGLRISIDNSFDWIMTLSNDTELDAEYFQNFNALFPLPLEVGMLSPKVRSIQERTKLDATGLAMSLDGMSSARGQREEDLGQYDHLTDILMPNGVSGIYSNKLLTEVGVLDESFEAYCEDIDLGLRAWLAGWNCKFIPKSIVYHARSATYGEFSLQKLYLVERNHYWVAIKNLPLPLVILNPLFTFYRYLMQVYAVLTGSGQGSGYGTKYPITRLLSTTLKALLHAVLGAPRAFGQRLHIRALRKRSYFEMLSAFWRRRMRFRELILK